jgi:hypothetical protein
MSKKPERSLVERIELEVFAWTWVVAWFAAIWWEPLRWELFGTGAFALVLTTVIARN